MNEPKDCVKLAVRVLDFLHEEGAEPKEQCATLITALALVVTTTKLPGCSVSEVKRKCVQHIGAAIDVLHVAREAQSPAR